VRPATLDEFASDPVGRYVSGNEYVHFCATPELWGVVLWVGRMPRLPER
jgi:hypothetical protein